MLNRLVALLLIVGIVVNPLASIPHAHAGMSPEKQRQHDAIPHIHHHGFPHDHGDDEHSHDGHQHHHSSDPVKSPDDQPQQCGLSGEVHHPTAFNLPAGSGAMAVTAGKPIGSPLLLLVKVAFTANWQPTANVEFGIGRLARERSSEPISDGSSLYLTLRNLRL